MRFSVSALLILSPVLIHGLIMAGRLDWAMYWLGGVIGIWGLISLASRKGKSAAGLVMLTAAGALLLLPAWRGQQLFRFIPLAMYLSLALLFASTLLPQRTPLITRFAFLMRQGKMPDEVIHYTRRVTLLWVLFFCSMAAVTLWLALFGDIHDWSLFVNVISYVLMALLFLAEFAYRRWRLGKLVDYSFTEFLGGLVRLDYAQLFRSR